MSAAIAAWRFGIPGGIATCILLAPIIFSPFIFGLRETNIWIDLGLIGFGTLVSLGIGKLGNIQRLLVKTTQELQRQATELRSEITERERIEEEVRTLSLRAIESLVSALEAKDKYTAGHSRRVTEIAVAIGRRMDLSADDLETLRCGSLLHDVGKIAVEQYIQNKPDKLTSDEYEHVMIHVEAEADIVRPVVDRQVVELILHHHDHYDGGNPHQSLVGEAIPLGARIIAVADAFDAMTSDRPYRLAMPIMAARTEIQQYIGTQFDPFVVRMFLEIPMAEVASMI